MALIELDGQYIEALPHLAVHSAISYADAILIGCVGRRGSDGNHKETLTALRKLCDSKRRSVDGLKHLAWLLGNKTELVYGDKNFDMEEAKSAKLHAERFVTWAFNTFPEISRAGVPE
jgi:hypothetical protein